MFDAHVRKHFFSRCANDSKVYVLRDLKAKKKRVTVRNVIFHGNQRAFHEEPEKEELDIFFELGITEPKNRDEAST